MQMLVNAHVRDGASLCSWSEDKQWTNSPLENTWFVGYGDAPPRQAAILAPEWLPWWCVDAH